MVLTWGYTNLPRGLNLDLIILETVQRNAGFKSLMNSLGLYEGPKREVTPERKHALPMKR